MKKFLSYTLSFALGLSIAGGVALAKNGWANLSAEYANIMINVNGENFIPKDVNGIVVEPFIIDGTTYLPIRAVSEALNNDVSWDSADKVVNISDKSPKADVYPKLLGEWRAGKSTNIETGEVEIRDITKEIGDFIAFYENGLVCVGRYHSDGMIGTCVMESDHGQNEQALFIALTWGDGPGAGVDSIEAIYNNTEKTIITTLDLNVQQPNGEIINKGTLLIEWVKVK
jgi:hypothetical protein